MAYNHKEAFCLMRYASRDGRAAEMLWNSRDGVTPFGLRGRSDVEMFHVEWENDRPIERFLPPIGMRIFVDMTKERLREIIKERVDAWWNHPSYPMSKAFTSKEAAVENLFHGEWRPGTPDVVEVTREIREKMSDELLKSGEPFELGDSVDLERARRGWRGPVRSA